MELVGVVVGEAGHERLNRFTLTLRPGEIVGLIGPTGMGKTSALCVMSGALAPAKGRIAWEGREITRSPARLRALTAMATDELPGPWEFSVGAWVRYWASLDGAAQGSEAPRLDELLSRFDLAAHERRPVQHLSRGMKRRLGLMRAFLVRPKVLLLDGLEDGLDGAGLRMVTGLVRDAASAGTTVVLTSGTPHLPTTLCDRVAVLGQGAVLREHARTDPAFASSVAAAQGWTA